MRGLKEATSTRRSDESVAKKAHPDAVWCGAFVHCEANCAARATLLKACCHRSTEYNTGKRTKQGILLS
jgi:hypothetical protein